MRQLQALVSFPERKWLNNTVPAGVLIAEISLVRVTLGRGRLFLRQFHPSIFGTTVFAAVIGDGAGLTVALGGEPTCRDAFISQIFHHRLGASVGQCQVGFGRADVVCVATHFEL